MRLRKIVDELVAPFEESPEREEVNLQDGLRPGLLLIPRALSYGF
jgi:hypothetical protein